MKKTLILIFCLMLSIFYSCNSKIEKNINTSDIKEEISQDDFTSLSPLMERKSV